MTDHIRNLVSDGQVVGHLLAILMQRRPAAETVGQHRAGTAPATPEVPFPVSFLRKIWLHVTGLVRLAARNAERGIRTANFYLPNQGVSTASIPKVFHLGLRKYLLKLKGDQPPQISQ